MKPKSKPRKAKPSPRQSVKWGRVMYENVFGEITNDPTHGGGWDKPVLVLDLSPEARERRVEAAKAALYAEFGPSNLMKLRLKPDQFKRLERFAMKQSERWARAALASLGDTPAGEGRGK